MYSYRDTIDLPDILTLRDAEEIEAKLREVGRAEKDGMKLRFEFVEDDLWSLCERAWEIAGELSTRGVEWTPSRDYVEEVEDA